MSKLRLAIFASGTGTNAEKIIEYFADHAAIEVALVVSNRCKAGVLERAEKASIEAVIISKDDWADEEMVVSLLRSYDIDWIALSGFLLKVPEYLITEFKSRIVNIHPALLPKFGGPGMYGMNVHRAVKDAGETESGITIHLVNEEYDKGQIIFQAAVSLHENDEAEDIQKKVQILEHQHFAHIIESLMLSA